MPVMGTLFDFCMQRDCCVCVLTARWMSDARPPPMGRIQMGFCAGPDRLKEARRVSQLIHGTCRERQHCFLDRTVLLANCFTKISESQADLATVSLSGHMRIFGRVLKANNRSGSEMLFVVTESSYLSVIQPRNVCYFLIHCQLTSLQVRQMSWSYPRAATLPLERDQDELDVH